MARDPGNLLVTGGCGFVGSAFIRYCFQVPEFRGHLVNVDKLTEAGNPENVRGFVDSARYHFIQGDILDADLLLELCDRHAIDTLVHFAAETHVDRSIHDPEAFIETNVLGTGRLLGVLKARPKLFLHHVSTDEVFGALGAEGQFHEHSPYGPRSPYAATKAAADHLVRAYGITFGCRFCISHSCNNYGPYQLPEKLVPMVITRLLEGLPLPIYGDGLQRRDWIHVDDHARAIWLLLQHATEGESYMVGARTERTNQALISQLTELVAETSGRPLADLRALWRHVQDRPGHDRRYAVDCSKLESELGFKPQIELGHGLRETVRWYQEHSAWVEAMRSPEHTAFLEQNYGGRLGAGLPSGKD